MFRFIHTADWQIGKVFRFAGAAQMGLLQQARLDAITRIGGLAREHGAADVLVAGDVYDMEALSSRSLNQPLERMREFPDLRWHLLPGNHDPQRPNGLWDRIRARGLPHNLIVHAEPEPRPVDGAAVILPAPLQHRRSLNDPTAWMDGAETAAGLIRVGLAHGSVHGFASDETQRANPIDPQRPASARLDYLALGDWHGQQQVSERCWYSGTPEVDKFNTRSGGRVLLVEIAGPGMTPAVTPLATGRYLWRALRETIQDRAGIDYLDQQLRNLSAAPAETLVDLTLSGSLSLEDTQYFAEQIEEGASAALMLLRIDRSQLYPQPTEEDLDRIDPGGVVRSAADALRAQAAGGGSNAELAREALLRLYLEYRRLEAGS